MPITLRGARVLKELSNSELRVLNMVETLLKKGEYAPKDRIAAYSGYTEKEVDFYLSKLHKLKLIKRWTGQFVGYTLTLSGFDTLALNSLYNKKIVYGIGRSRGVGKESDLYYALDFNEKEIVIKINRTGRASFQKVKRRRDFLKNRFHYSMFLISQLSAKREFEILSSLQNKKLPVPKVLGYNRHIIAMDEIKGVELVNVKELKNPIKILEQIIKFARRLYQEFSLIHGDLTEFNVLYNPEKEKITVIDFPQAIPADHPDGKDILKRDLSHLLSFFKKNWGITADESDTVIEYITS
ncbi:MAG: serine/threonine-protein kinase RIO2 [Candidatus Heimdallarchaeaceae archaeon]